MKISKINLKITHKNILLKILNKEDYTQRYLSWLKDKKINQYLETRFTKITKKTILNHINFHKKSDENYLFGIYILSKNKYNHIGNIKIGPINYNHKFSEISYFIGDINYWGKGFASTSVNLISRFGFNKLKLNKCIAGVYSSNIGSINVLKKNGYIIEGKLKNHLIYNNRYNDKLILSCTKKQLKKIF